MVHMRQQCLHSFSKGDNLSPAPSRKSFAWPWTMQTRIQTTQPASWVQPSLQPAKVMSLTSSVRVVGVWTVISLHFQQLSSSNLHRLWLRHFRDPCSCELRAGNWTSNNSYLHNSGGHFGTSNPMVGWVSSQGGYLFAVDASFQPSSQEHRAPKIMSNACVKALRDIHTLFSAEPAKSIAQTQTNSK